MKSYLSWYQSQTDTTRRENHRSIFLMNINAKLSTLVNQTQKHVKRNIHHDHVQYIQGMQKCFNKKIKQCNKQHYENKWGGKNHMIILVDEENAFHQIWHPCMITTLRKLGIEGSVLKIIKGIYEKTTANIIIVINWKLLPCCGLNACVTFKYVCGNLTPKVVILRGEVLAVIRP